MKNIPRVGLKTGGIWFIRRSIRRTGGDIWYVRDPLEKGRKAVPFLATASNESQGQISPDGHMMAYTSNESGQEEVYVRPFPDGTGKSRISNKGGREPQWRRDGSELYYLEGLTTLHRVMAVAVTAGASQRFGSPVALFDLRANTLVSEGNGFSYAVAGGGQKFLVNGLVGGERATVDVLVDWRK